MHGCYTSNRAVAECDVLIAVGTRFSDRVALNPKTFAKNATIIQIDIDAASWARTWTWIFPSWAMQPMC